MEGGLPSPPTTNWMANIAMALVSCRTAEAVVNRPDLAYMDFPFHAPIQQNIFFCT